jgi:5'-nucleotidase
MKNILVSNDDGILSPGIQTLAKSLGRLGKVTVVAPSQEQSTTGHSLTLHKPIRLEKVKPGFYHINGTPADCIYLSVKRLFKDKKIDLVVSGINRGPNLGNDIHYSGTVAAAREATFLKLPAMAVSLDYHQNTTSPNFDVAAEYAYLVAKLFLAKGIPKQVLINVNVPAKPLKDIRGIKITKTGFRYYADHIVEQKDPRGKNYYWLSGKYLGYEKAIADSDCKALDENYVSVTPLHIDSTHHQTLKKIKKWNFKSIHEKIKKTL